VEPISPTTLQNVDAPYPVDSKFKFTSFLLPSDVHQVIFLD